MSFAFVTQKYFLSWSTLGLLMLSSVGMLPSSQAQEIEPVILHLQQRVESLTFSPNGKTLAVGTGGTVAIWDLATRSQRYVIRNRGVPEIRSLVFTPDGKSLIAPGGYAKEATSGASFKVWSVATGQETQFVETPHDVMAFAIARNSQLLAAATREGKKDAAFVKLYDLAEKKETGKLRHGSIIYSVALSPDYASLVSAADDGTLKVWNLNSKKERTSLRAHEGGAYAVDWSSNGKIVASAGQDKKVLLWTAPFEEEPRILTGHKDSVLALAFSPDSTLLATASPDGSIKLWNVEKGTELLTLQKRGEMFKAVAFSPNGKILVGGGDARSVKLWDISTVADKKSAKD